jgi:EAL and modified HD-GYP domain-containing signal transduction protein
VGYEVLYRDKPGAAPKPWDPDAATEHVAGLLLAHHSRLVEGRLAFLNTTHSFMVSGLYRRLPPLRTVLEITEDTVVDGRLVDAIVAASACGYRIALDDFRFGGPQVDLIPLVDVIKVDVLAAGQSPIEAVPSRLRAINPDAVVLAEKVERPAGVDSCLENGYDLLQGFAISRPVRITCVSGSRSQ